MCSIYIFFFCLFLEVAYEEMDTSTSTIIGLIGLQTHTKKHTSVRIIYRSSDRITHRIKEDRNESDLRTQCKCNKCERFVFVSGCLLLLFVLLLLSLLFLL